MNNSQLSQVGVKTSAVSASRITSRADLVEANYFQPDCRLPLVITPAMSEVDLLSWAGSNRAFIEAHLLREGAILFRNFHLQTTEEFEQLIETVSGKLLDYSYRS